MENCGVHAGAYIQILDIPVEGTSFTLTTPNNTPHRFVYTFVDTGTGKHIPLTSDDTVETVSQKTANKIIETELFLDVVCEPQPYNKIWINQKVIGTAGNTHNFVDGLHPNVVIVDFSGGTNNPAENPYIPHTGYVPPNVPEFQANFDIKRAKEYKQLFAYQKELNKKKKSYKNCKILASYAALNLIAHALCPCPTCSASNKVKDKVAGKNYFTIPFTDFKVPRIDHIVDKTPTFDQNRREGQSCGACGGAKTIPDVTDDSAKYKQVAQKIEQNSQKLLETESKLGLGGTRTTIIQGSDLLFVGLGFNNNKTYENIPGGSIAPSMKGGKIPQQNATPVNAVVGKQGSLAWPQQVGNYTIKCANKFSLLAGAGGITIATPGPLTFSSGMLKIVGPQVAIGSATGPLTLEGDSVNIAGKAISVTPSGGELFVKGNINNTGNITTQGHAHFESASFVKASCVGITRSTYTAKANPDVLQTQPATWGAKALSSAILDLQAYFQSIPTDSKTSAFRLFSPKEGQNLADRLKGMASLALPWELVKTGYILPGTLMSIKGWFPCNWGGMAFGVATGMAQNLIEIHNIPHMHGIPEMMHKHEVLLPDMDYTNDSPEALRGKVLDGTHESGVPSDPTKDTASRLAETQRTAVEFAAAAKVEGTKLVAKTARFFA